MQVQSREIIAAAGLAVPSHEQLTAAFVEAGEEGAASLSFLQLRQCCLRLGYHNYRARVLLLLFTSLRCCP